MEKKAFKLRYYIKFNLCKQKQNNFISSIGEAQTFQSFPSTFFFSKCFLMEKKYCWFQLSVRITEKSWLDWEEKIQQKLIRFEIFFILVNSYDLEYLK